jgi:diaminopimelate epimerase
MRVDTESIDSRLPYALMEANGNCILLVDQTEGRLAGVEPTSELAVAACVGLGDPDVDGVAFITREPLAMRFFDRDGTRETMCGNALRCIGRYAHDLGGLEDRETVHTDDGPKQVSMTPDGVEAVVGAARDLRVVGEGTFVFTGVPHLVVPTDDVEAVDVARSGRRLRCDEALGKAVGHPEGVNVNFVELRPEGPHVRTYEVGVEDETLSCGTGAVATAYVANLLHDYPFPMTVHTRGGSLTVREQAAGISITGSVTYRRMNMPALRRASSVSA